MYTQMAHSSHHYTKPPSSFKCLFSTYFIEGGLSIFFDPPPSLTNQFCKIDLPIFQKFDGFLRFIRFLTVFCASTMKKDHRKQKKKFQTNFLFSSEDSPLPQKNCDNVCFSTMNLMHVRFR